MASDLQTKRNTWIAGSIAAIVLFTVIYFSSVRLLEGRAGEPRIGARSPADELAYCGPEDMEVCVVSFSQVADGNMQVNLQVPDPDYPEFILVIDRYGVESTYECRREEELDEAVTCTGPMQVPGEVLQFKLVSNGQGTLLAEGKFSIIGIALATPEGDTTATAEGDLTGTPATPTRTPPMILTPGTPTTTPTPTPTLPSYPNPYP